MLESLPFMPEMLRYCDRTFRVTRRADKTCDGEAHLRRMADVVHLEDLRCDGSAHGGCQAACLIFWKEAWLERVGPARQDAGEAASAVRTDQLATAVAVLEPTTRSGSESDYRCQATQVVAATTPLGWADVRQYRTDVKNWGLAKVGRGVAVSAFNKLQGLSARRLPPRLRLRDGERYPRFRGRLTGPPPQADLGLRPGDLVRVKTAEEIAATVSDTEPPALRGLSFDVEMLRYCGRTARVRARVNKIIDERTGKMIHIKSDCLMLEDFICVADFHRFCSRGVYVYWREAWLERVE
jgi:hypothetical protein